MGNTFTYPRTYNLTRTTSRVLEISGEEEQDNSPTIGITRNPSNVENSNETSNSQNLNSIIVSEANNSNSNSNSNNNQDTNQNNNTSIVNTLSSNLDFASNWLFGNTNQRNVNLLQTLRNGPQLYPKETVQFPLLLHKNSLQIIQVREDDKLKYRVQFTFDCTEKTLIKVITRVNEMNVNPKTEIRFLPEKENSWISFEPGFSHVYIQPNNEYLDFKEFNDEDLTCKPETLYFPLVIIMKTDNPLIKKPNIPMFILYSNFIRCSDDTFVVKSIGQKIRCNGKNYAIHDIFGLDGSGSGSHTSVDTATNDQMKDDSSGKECVVCITELRDTVVFPCRHLCLCSTCAVLLKQHQSNRCPICRSIALSLIHIKMIPKEKEGKLEEIEEEEELIMKKKQPQLNTPIGKLEIEDEYESSESNLESNSNIIEPQKREETLIVEDASVDVNEESK